jgi:hypothetical protein
VLVRAPTREAPAELRQHQRLAVDGPAERADLAGLLDARLCERGVVQDEAAHRGGDLPDRGDRRDAGVQREGTVGAHGVRAP